MWDSAIDWITATARCGEKESEILEDIALSALGRMQQAGHTLQRRSYEGYIGLSCGSVFFGSREDGCCARVSGSPAHPFACELAEQCPSVNVSRIDLQNTIKSDTDVPTHARDVLTMIEAAHKKSGSKRALNFEFKHRKNKGDCLWIGSRTSSRFFRIYDKTREQDGLVPPNLWRYEVEFKGKQAAQIWRTMVQTKCSPKVITDIVVAGFLLKGVDLSWIEQAEPRRLPSSYQKTDIERKLQWIERNVSRTSKELIDAGYEDQLRKWLGFGRTGGDAVPQPPEDWQDGDE